MKGSQILPWPASSPDLSPLDYAINNCLKQEVRSKVDEKAKPEAVRDAIVEVCDEMPQDYNYRVIGAFPDKLRK